MGFILKDVPKNFEDPVSSPLNSGLVMVSLGSYVRNCWTQFGKDMDIPRLVSKRISTHDHPKNTYVG